LERLGVRTVELPTDLAIDAFAARYGTEYAIVLNSNTPNDRCRLDAAHEVVHVLLGDCDQSAKETKEIEKRAFRVGSLFLLPERKLREAFVGKSLVRLLKYKETFGISLAAMVYRAQQSKILSERETTWLWREFAKRGWRREEPGYVRPDRAMRFEYMLESAIQTKKLTWNQAESLTGVSESELRQRLNQALGIDPMVQEGGDEPPQTLKLFG
jgi:Zn-dependent peptidase ImmA (M78 family)